MEITRRNPRISSIDLLRGVVMVIMALDHVRDYLHYSAFFFDPTDLSRSSVPLFFTRFVTHFCAPVFVFLAGTSAFFVGQRRTKKELSSWLLKRGLWLIIVELTIIKLAWTFKLDYTIILLQVIWALGVGMIVLAGLIHLPGRLTVILCLIGVFAHNAFDAFSPGGAFASALWTFLHQFNIIPAGPVQIFVGYPLIPWVFLMPLGYYFGNLYLPRVDPLARKRALRFLGGGMILVFCLLRLPNLYGDPAPWISYDSFAFSVMSFLNVSKYPPSLQYLLITLGPAMLFLSVTETWRGAIPDILLIIGRVPMFFYIVHIYVIHLIAAIAAMLTGFTFSDMVIDIWVTLQPQLRGFGFSLWVVYLVWIAVVAGLFPFCRWYDSYKRSHPHLWWLGYL